MVSLVKFMLKKGKTIQSCFCYHAVMKLKRSLFLLLSFITWVTQSAFAEIRENRVFINQVGYSPDAPKVVYSDFSANRFEVTDLDTQKVVLTGEMKQRSLHDAATGLMIYEGDFSSLVDPGRYVVKVGSDDENCARSYPFSIQQQPYAKLTQEAFKILYYQRCGFELKSDVAGVFNRPACHLELVEYHPTTGQTGKLELTGGWHDAGDYGKYIAPGSVTVGSMFLAYQINSEFWRSDNMAIPESGNGIPDLLDEMRYELEWMLKMQRTDGAVHEKIHTKDYVGFIMPDRPHEPRYLYEVTSTATGDFAAIMAWASTVFAKEKSDPDFAEKCLHAAVQAYDYLNAHPEIFPEGGFTNPPDTVAGGYSDAQDKDERLWAAIELYLATGKDHYLSDANALMSSTEGEFGTMGWQNPQALGFLHYLLEHHRRTDEEKPNTQLAESIMENLLKQCEAEIKIAANDGFRVALELDDYVWGSNGIVVSRAMNHIVAYELTGDERFKELAVHQLHHILGTNCKSICYLTGQGSHSPENIHHAVVVADGIFTPIPGFLAGGPDPQLNDAVLKEIFSESTPPQQTYVDHVESYASNEITIYWNAFFLFVSAYFNQ